MDDLKLEAEHGAEAAAPSMDDINALLAKAGLSPIGEDGTDPPSAPAAPAAEKTRHFALPKEETQTAAQQEKTRVIPTQPKTAPAAEKAEKGEKKNDSQLLLDGFDDDPKKIWESNIFGKSLHELVNEGLHNKLYRMPADARRKIGETIQKIINDGCNGLICIIL